MTTPLLSVTDLQVVLRTTRGPAVAVRDLSFTLAPGDTLGLVGESGCGKSLTALALMGLLPEGAQVSGSIRLNGRELVGLPEREMAALRGDRIAMVFQEPMTALNPVHTVADGDTLFALATGRHDKHPGMMVLATMAAEAVARATVRAVLAAQAITAVNAQGQTQYLPAARDL